MDLSEQQQYQYHYQQQQESAAASAAAYDPSQSQSYDPYYAYHHNHQQYYDYSSTQTYPHPDPSPQIHHPQAPAAMNPAAAAAVAALSQLSQFAGSMDAAQKAVPHNLHHQYPQHYPMEQGHVSIRPAGGGGRRGGGPFRGGGRRGGGRGRGNFSCHPPRQDGGAPCPIRGRGRGRGRMGRGGGRKQHQSAPDSQPTHTAAASVEQSSAPVQPRLPLLPIAWCDICRVDCNSLEILEQHKNGKRHKKTVQRIEEIQRQQKLFAESQGKVMPDMMLPNAVTEKAAEVGEAKKDSVSPQNTTMGIVLPAKVGEVTNAFATIDNNPAVVFSEAQQDSEAVMDKAQTVDGQLEPAKVGSETDAVAEEPLTEGSTRPPRSDGNSQFDRRRGGMKRKITKFGRGGKRLKSSEPVRRRVPERQQPRVCTLCNVMCETLVVFESHLAGKKHISKLKRFQGQGTVFGPITVYIPPNQPSAYPTQGQEPLFYGLNSHEMLQYETYMGLNGLQAENYGFHQGVKGEQDGGAEGGVSETPAIEGLEHAKCEVIPANRGEKVAIMDNTENQDAAAASTIDFESKEPDLLPVAPETGSLEKEAALILTEDALSVPEFGTLPGDDVLSGLDAKVELPSVDFEELNDGVEMSIQ